VVSANQGDGGVEVVEIRLLDGVESAEGSTRFVVRVDQVVPMKS
jgi:hypothetical protein